MLNDKLISTFLILLVCCSPLVFSVESSVSPNLSHIKDPANLISDEISRLDDLIEATQQSLENQLNLKERIKDYQKTLTLYLKNTEDNELLFQLIKSAYRTLQSIKENHLEHTFDSEFISELTVLSQVATKRGIPKP